MGILKTSSKISKYSITIEASDLKVSQPSLFPVGRLRQVRETGRVCATKWYITYRGRAANR